MRTGGVRIRLFGSALAAASGGRAIAALATAFSLLAGSALAAQQRQVGSWVLKWGSGNIGSYCTVESVQGGRTFGYQVVKTGQVFFGLRDPDWRWEPKSIHGVKLTVTDQAEWTGRAVSPLPEVLVLPVGTNPSPDPASAMGSGATLIVEVEGRRTSFDLKDFPEAAKAQRDCLAQPV
jgi:hypothetical protein